MAFLFYNPAATSALSASSFTSTSSKSQLHTRLTFISNQRSAKHVTVPIHMTPTSSATCQTCNDEKAVPCVECDAYGFIKVDLEAVWSTCAVCQGRGKLVCFECQPEGTRLPDEFLAKEKEMGSQ